MSKKKAKAPEPAGESAPMWIVSFADLVTLMMSFFVVLYALKQGGPQQQQILAGAISKEFGNDIQLDDPNAMNMLQKGFVGIPVPTRDRNNGHAETPADSTEGPDPTVNTIRDGKQITSGGVILFDSGSAVLTPVAKDVIRKVVNLVGGKTNILMVKGHVSADEVALRPEDPQGMSLSFLRATTVADEMARLGIDRRLLRPVPCGANEPLKAQVYDVANLKLNRRVEICSLESTLSDYFQTNTVQAATEQGAAPTPDAATQPAPPATQP